MQRIRKRTLDDLDCRLIRNDFAYRIEILHQSCFDLLNGVLEKRLGKNLIQRKVV